MKIKEMTLTERGARAFVIYLIRRYLYEHDNDVPAMASEFGVAKDTIWCILRGKVRVPVRDFLPSLLRYYSIPVGFQFQSAKGFRKKKPKFLTVTMPWDPIGQMSRLLSTIMNEAGMNMCSMSKFTGINRTTIKSLISGDHFPRSETLRAILRPFGYTCVLNVYLHDKELYKGVQMAVLASMVMTKKKGDAT